MFRLICGCLLLFFSALPVEAAKRVALVVGNSAYEHVAELANPANDAADMSAKLRSLGFTVIEGRDLGLTDLRGKVREFVSALTDAEMGLFYYAGHGLQVSGENYIAPVDARLETFDDLDFEALPIGMVLSAMERKTKTNLVFLDACRNNPLARNLARSMGTRSAEVGRGLARISSGVGTLISFSTQPGNVALDGTGRNSPFTSALVKHIGTPGEDIARSLRKVRNDVLNATGGKQVPWENSSLTGDVILNASLSPATTVQIQPQPVPEPGPSVDEVVKAAIKVNTPRGWDLLRRSHGSSVMARPDVLRALSKDGQAGPPAQTREASLRLSTQQKRQVQSALNDAGYTVGSADGVWGSRTRAGIRDLQADLGMENTGFVDETVLEHLGISRPVTRDDSTFANAKFAWSHDPDALRLLGEDERIVEIAECLGRRRSVYGRRGNSLYFVVISSSSFREYVTLFEKCGGYPASVTSKAENDFIYSLIEDEVEFFEFGFDAKNGYSYKGGPYFGMRQDPVAREPDGGWRWYNGEAVGYTNWRPGRPKESRKGQNNAQYHTDRRGRVDLKKTDARGWFDNRGHWAKSAVMEVDF